MKNGNQAFREYLDNNLSATRGESGATRDEAAASTVGGPDLSEVEWPTNTVEVMLLHEDLQTGLRAKHILDHLEARLEPKPRFLVELWRFDMLEEPELQQQAVHDAMRANIAIISLHGHRELCPAVRQWLHGWIEARSGGSCALVVSLDANLRGSVAVDWTLEYLRRTATQAGLDIFPHYGETPSNPQNWLLSPPAEPHRTARDVDGEHRRGLGMRLAGGINE